MYQVTDQWILKVKKRNRLKPFYQWFDKPVCFSVTSGAREYFVKFLRAPTPEDTDATIVKLLEKSSCRHKNEISGVFDYQINGWSFRVIQVNEDSYVRLTVISCLKTDLRQRKKRLVSRRAREKENLRKVINENE